MEEHGLQLSPEMIDGNNKVEEAGGETEMNTAEAEVTNREEEDEEFYERIEAPKFVDFTKPNPFRPDDRYWFCSRVGCDRKHEEEIDPEEISKNFVLRVMAARSPNIKLRKAMLGKHSSMKCPLSAPAKPSKSRISQLAMVSSSISHKIVDPESKIRPLSKVSSTPMAKSRQVAAKYMTTPRNKRCLPNRNSFRSVQNPKLTTVHVPKNRTVAKALVFHSPKKAISLKRSVELYTPLTKICEGMKRLEIKSQKKTSKDTRSNTKKPATEDSSRRQLRNCKSEKRLPSQNGKEQEPMSSKSTKTRSKKILTLKCHPLHEQVVENKSSDKDVDVKSRDGYRLETSGSDGGNGHEQATISLPNLEDKENMGSVEDQSSEMVTNYDTEQKDTNYKENALNSEDNNSEFSNHQLGKKILGKETLKKSKVAQALDKNLKSGLTAIGAAPALVKYKKPKPTNVKPFRLRTDERGILKEAILEKKLHFPEKEAAKDTSVTIKSPCVQKQTADLKISRGQVGPKSASSSDTTQRRPESTQQRSNSLTSQALSRRENTSRTRSLRHPQGVASPRKVMKLSVIKEKSCKVTCDVMVTENKIRTDSASRSTARGKRPVTVAKEPNFQSSHLPRSCTKKVK